MEFLQKIEPFLIYGIIKGLLYGLLAVGFCLVYKTTRIFHIAYGFIYTAAAYFALFLIQKASLGVSLSIILALFFTCLVGWCIEKFVYFPLKIKGASSGVHLVSSVGAYIIGINLIALYFGNETQILNPGTQKTFTFHHTVLAEIQLLQTLMPFVLLVAFFLFLKRFKLGKMITALSNDPELFKVLGWCEKSVRSAVFILSSFFAGTAALLLAFDVGMDPHVGMNAVLIGAVAMIIGGVKNIGGAAIAGVGLGVLQNLVVWLTSARWEQSVTFCILILYLLIFRKRILGKIRIEET